MKPDHRLEDITADASWPRMEAMLDRHYKAKRRRRVIAFWLTGIVLTGAFFYGINRPGKKDGLQSVVNTFPSGNANVNSPKRQLSANPNTEGQIVSGKHLDPSAPIPSVTRDGQISGPAVASNSIETPAAIKHSNIAATRQSARVPSSALSTTALSSASSSANSGLHAVGQTVSGNDSRKNQKKNNLPVNAEISNSSRSDNTRGSGEVSHGHTDALIQNQVSTEFVKQDGSTGHSVGNPPAASQTTPTVTGQLEQDRKVSSQDAAASANEDKSGQDIQQQSQVNSLQEPKVPASDVATKESPSNAAVSDKPQVSQDVSWSISAYTGLNQYSKQLSGSNASWTDRRTAEEKSVIRSSWGVGIERTIRNWSMGAGIEYAQPGERTKYDSYSIGRTLVENSYWSYRIDSVDTLYLSGNRYFMVDPNPNVVDSSKVVFYDTAVGRVTDPAVAAGVRDIRWKYVAVPISFSYRIKTGKWSFGAAASAIPAMLVGTTGDYIRQDQSGLTKADRIANTRRFQLSAGLGLQAEYGIAGPWSVMISPQWRRQFFSVYSKDSGIGQRYSSWGVNLGLRCRLK